MTRTVRSAALPALACLTLLLGACSSGDGDEPAGPSATTATPTAADEPEPASAEPVGAGCAGLPADGPGSIAGMADQPLFAVLSAEPELSSMVEAVVAAGLGATMDSTANITLLAPTNAAFAAVPPEQVQGLLADTPRLTATLVHHVVPGRLGPDDLAGTHTTLNNDQLTVEGAAPDLTVPGNGTLLQAAPATVVCGNLQTANATVYLIDQVLTPTG